MRRYMKWLLHVAPCWIDTCRGSQRYRFDGTIHYQTSKSKLLTGVLDTVISTIAAFGLDHNSS